MGLSLFLLHPQRQAKYSENKMKCTKARNDYLLNLAATNALVAKYYIHDVSDMIDVSQSQEWKYGWKWKYSLFVRVHFFQFKFVFGSVITMLCFFCPQCCDLGYHASLARTLRTYLSAEYSLETSRHEGLDLLEGAVDAMDTRGDKMKFMDTHCQIFCPPACFDYQPHMGDEVSQQGG